MTKPHRLSHLASTKGFTLIELMVVIVIVGLLTAMGIPQYQGYLDKARLARCIAEIRYLERDIQAYYVANDKYPNSMADLHLSIQSMLDPWGNPYQYFLIAGTKWVSNSGDGTTYYARESRDTFYAREMWKLNFLAAAAESEEGFWSGSWFVSEAWAKKDPDPTPTPIPPSSGQSKPRKDRFLKPITSDYDLYSMGPDGKTKENLNAKESMDDIVRASEGAYVGLAADF